MRRLRKEDGFALITALILLTVMVGLGLSLLFLTDNQQKASSKEQAGESAFTLAEAALNAQVGQLSRSWPSEAGLVLPERCTPSSTQTGCPSAESLKVGYPNSGSASCPAGTPKDAWGSPLSNGWTTYVRNAVGEPNQLFNSTVEQSAVHWAETGEVWVRSVGVINCRMAVLVALISPQIITLPFPQTAIAGNWFATSNNGNKIIVNTKGQESESGGVGMRCSERTASNCETFREGQIEPDTKVSAPPETTWTASQLETAKKEAQSASPSTYFPTGKCPASLAAASGSPVYVEGPCNLSFNGSEVGNSATKAGFLVLVNGTFELSANAEFFGTVYAVNAQKSSSAVVTLHGHSKLTGSIVVDGNGGIEFGSSGNGNGHSEEEIENFVYSKKATETLKTFAGASATHNSFRILPNNQ